MTGQKRKAETQLTSAASKRSALGDSTNHEDQTIVRELRRAHYKKRPAAQTEKDGKKTNLEVGSPMDDFINAAGDLDCRRIVSALFFDNDKRREFYLRSAATIADSRFLAKDDHLLCDPALPGGCTRCRPRTFPVCCDLCNPEAFQFLNFEITSKEKQPGKSHIKGFKMTDISRQLQIDLFNWCNEKANIKFPQAHVEDFGGGLLLSDQHVERILNAPVLRNCRTLKPSSRKPTGEETGLKS